MVSGRKDEALEAVSKMAAWNGVKIENDVELVVHEVDVHSSAKLFRDSGSMKLQFKVRYILR